MSSERCQFFKNLGYEVKEDVINNVVNNLRNNRYGSISKNIELEPYKWIRFFLSYSDNGFKIWVLKNGMKRFEGEIDNGFKMHGNCIFYEDGIKVEEGIFKQGKRDGRFIQYDSHCNESSIEVYKNDVKISMIIVKNSKRFLESCSSDTRSYGECSCFNERDVFHGRVIECDSMNDKEKQISLFERGERKAILVRFLHENGRSIMIEYDWSKNHDPIPLFIGEYTLDRDSLTYTHEGFGMCFKYLEGIPTSQDRLVCIYRGCFKNNLFDGFGCSFDPNTGLKNYEGEWKDGVPRVGKTFVDGVEREISIKTEQEIIDFPESQYKLSFQSQSFGDCQDIDLNKYESIQHIQEIEFKSQSFLLLEDLVIFNHSSLKVLTVEDDTFATLKQFSLIKCSAFTTLTIGEKCMNKVEKLNLEILPRLNSITVGFESLTACSTCVLHRIPKCTLTISNSSLTSLSTVVSNMVSDSFLSEFTANSSGRIDNLTTSYTISDSNTVTQKEFCRELILKKESFPKSSAIDLAAYVDLECLKFEEGCYPCLHSFVIPNILPRLESISIANNCASEGKGEFLLNGLSSLKVVQIDDGCFTSYIRFSIQNCNNLKVLRIGTKRDITNILELKESPHSFKSGKYFTIDNCAVLEEVSIHGCCFTSLCEATIQNCPLLSTLSVGSLCFCNCYSLILHGLTKLEAIDIQPFAFYRCQRMDVTSCHKDLTMVTFSTDHFKNMNMREFRPDKHYPLERVVNSCIVNEVEDRHNYFYHVYLKHLDMDCRTNK